VGVDVCSQKAMETALGRLSVVDSLMRDPPGAGERPARAYVSPLWLLLWLWR
jgi:hypothetical protein